MYDDFEKYSEFLLKRKFQKNIYTYIVIVYKHW